ncbi:FtsX-like permease family protein [Pseudoramibacter sp.]|jgi:putative ABC transport system permease protein|uniref:ABC transporter permease n=1 Tax=Pseudoramibacter sp. TaxID=2034862 RepID=UPI0025DCF401|nr:ABC transporter permease [Pseudoramibacter sp.]MCH4071849.1 ABC transporter permease [Pseudoramibacter sp.]MCH4105618.1 ABC transporter permease [Pseudoramibacter sp.]
MKAFQKDMVRTVRGNLSRFIAMLFIIAVGICFVTGISGISPKILNSIDELYQKQNVPDVIIKSKSAAGFSAEELALLKKAGGTLTSMTEIDTKDSDTRLSVVDFNRKVDRFVLKAGRFPENADEVAVEQSGSHIAKRAVGDQITVNGRDYKIAGIVFNPLILSTEGTVNQMNRSKYLKTIVYFSADHNPFMQGQLPVTDVYLKFDGMPGYFDDGYLDKAEKKTEAVKKDLKAAGYNTDGYVFMTLKQEYGYAYIKKIMDNVDVLARVFPVFFILVVGLLTLTNMSRLIDEDRPRIGCLMSLGYAPGQILTRYLGFAAASTAIGEAIGLAAGVRIIPDLVYEAVRTAVFLPEKATGRVYLPTGIISAVLMFAAVMLVTGIVARKTVRERPVGLFFARAQKPGRKILLEKIRPVWDHMSFKYKSTWRNIFRYKGRLWMIVISITGSTLLVMAGLGVYDCVGDLKGIDTVALAILVFALLLSVLVLYNITTMNIGERTREIATLEVLGYKAAEVDGYIYREIVIMATFGILIGIPAGTAFLYFIFKKLEFGGLGEMHAVTYILAFVISELFVFLVVLLTKHHVKRVDMNASLKSLE